MKSFIFSSVSRVNNSGALLFVFGPFFVSLCHTHMLFPLQPHLLLGPQILIWILKLKIHTHMPIDTLYVSLFFLATKRYYFDGLNIWGTGSQADFGLFNWLKISFLDLFVNTHMPSSNFSFCLLPRKYYSLCDFDRVYRKRSIENGLSVPSGRGKLRVHTTLSRPHFLWYFTGWLLLLVYVILIV